MTDAQYVTIGGLWECRDCGVEGRNGKLGIVAHDLLRHVLGWSS